MRPKDGIGKRSPEARVKGEDQDVRVLKPLTYLEPDHERVYAPGIDTETCRAFGAGYVQPRAFCADALPFRFLIGDRTTWSPIAAMPCGRRFHRQSEWRASWRLNSSSNPNEDV